MQHTELRRTGKFLLFSCSAGLIELGGFALFNEAFHWPYWGAYLTALVLSVLWNFTCNRRYTFRSTEKVARAMALVFLYYCAFTPLSTLLEHRLADVQGWNGYLVTFFEHGAQFRDGVSLPALRGLPQLAGHEQIRALKRKRSRCVRERFPIRSRFSARSPHPAA